MKSQQLRTESCRFFFCATLKSGMDKIVSSRKRFLIFCGIIIALLSLTSYICFSAPDYLRGLYDYSFGILVMIGSLLAISKAGQARGCRAFYKDFLRIGFHNKAREAPVLIQRQEFDTFERLTFYCRGIMESEWQDRREDIQTAMNKSIVRIRPGQSYRTVIVDIVPPNTILGTDIQWKEEYLDKDTSIFTLGKSLAGPVNINIDRQPMLLIGGSTGSGKTMLCIVFLLQAIKKDCQVYICDFKGLDYWFLAGQNTTVITEFDVLKMIVNDLADQLQERIRYFKEIESYDFKDYQENDTQRKYKRTFLLIDECAEVLDLTGRTKEEKDLISQITKDLNTIARMGRAVGIHLIISTQRPDASAVPGSIKSNLDVRICGKADATLSTIILGDGRANEVIPKDSQGRFVLANGAEDIIFQGYYYDRNQI